MDIKKLAEKEIEFCAETEMEKNENGQYIYKSTNGASSVNLPYILLDYKQWLIENNILKTV